MGIAQTTAGQTATALMINQLPVVVSYMTTGTVSNSVAETVIGTFTIPGGDPTFPGGYTFRAFANVTATASPLLSVRVRLNNVSGALLLNAAGITVSSTPTEFAIDGALMFSAVGPSGAFSCDLKLNNAFSGSAALVAGLAAGLTIGTVGPNTIIVTAQFGTANASNTATGVGGAMYRL